MSTKKCVIYTRVSTVEQAKNQSLGVQKKACEEYARRNGYQIDRIFEEEGESAKTANRTKFQEMFVYLKEYQDKISAVILWKLDRFSRDVYDSLSYHNLLLSWDIKLISLTENIDQTPAGKFTSIMLAGMSQYENEVKSERTVAGMREAAGKGRWLWRAPFGYDLIDKELVVNDAEGLILKELFNQYVQSQSFRECSRFLEKKGIVRSSKVISKMLQNNVYIGFVESKLLEYPVPGNHEPLVSEEVFDRVQKIIEKNNGHLRITRRKKFDPSLYLRGLLYCDKCGARITGSWSRGKRKSYPYYRCLNNCFHERSKTIHKMIDDLLDTYVFDDRVINMFENSLKTIYDEQNQYSKKELQILKQQITKLETSKERVIDMRIDEELDEETYKKKVNKIDSELTFKKQAIKILDEKIIEVDV